MTAGVVLFWTLASAAAVGTLFGLHQLALWMERRGWLYYKYKQADSSASRRS